MSDRIHYTQCPVCSSASITNVLSVKDFTVSNEVFPVAECSNCALRFTQDVPTAQSIAPYYKSENYISHTDTAKGIVNRLYHMVRRRTLRGKRILIQQKTKLTTGTIADIGAGTGSFVNEMQSHGWKVTGLEPDSDARTKAKELYNIELQSTNNFYQLAAESFDAITLWHVLEHVHDLHDYVNHLSVILKKKGKLFIAVPNYTSKDAAIYKENWAAYDVPRHLYHFSPESMKVLMAGAGLVITEYKPMWYDSFYISLLSNKYKTGKSNLISSFWNGLRSNLTAMKDNKRCSSVIYIIEKKVTY